MLRIYHGAMTSCSAIHSTQLKNINDTASIDHAHSHAINESIDRSFIHSVGHSIIPSNNQVKNAGDGWMHNQWWPPRGTTVTALAFLKATYMRTKHKMRPCHSQCQRDLSRQRNIMLSTFRVTVGSRAIRIRIQTDNYNDLGRTDSDTHCEHRHAYAYATTTCNPEPTHIIHIVSFGRVFTFESEANRRTALDPHRSLPRQFFSNSWLRNWKVEIGTRQGSISVQFQNQDEKKSISQSNHKYLAVKSPLLSS